MGTQWLPASQTAGKKHPYLFTQCQAIHCRSMIPCHDMPGCKMRYDAHIVVPSPLVAVMSAKSVDAKSQPLANGKHVYSFLQNIPMPAYLIALAVGNLSKKEIGPRSAVWSEPEMVDAGAHEFAETEQFIKVGEELCGPYVWGRYDILLLPPSFP